MIRVSEEKFMERVEVVPQGLRDFLVSAEVGEILWLIGEVHHLRDERIGKIAAILSYIVLGLIHLEDLAKEVAAEADVDKRLAEELAREIKLKILNPIIPQLQQLYHYGSAGTVTPPAGTAAASATPPQPEVLKPSFTPPRNTGQPFILHEEQREIESVRPMEESLMRPSFFEETRDKRQETTEKPTMARLEIGGIEEVRKESSQVGKTEEPPVRVVHYSGPQTPVDPFSPSASLEQERPMEAPQPPKEIHPENIVDLKDLPK